MLMPFPNLNILSVSHAPLFSFDSTKYTPASIPMLKDQLFGARSNLNFVNSHDGKYIASLGIFRGTLSSYEIESMMSDVKQRQSEYFVPWLANTNTPLICSKPPAGHMTTGTQLNNSTAIGNLI